jgi:EEF1A lysine methyltransferase 4
MYGEGYTNIVNIDISFTVVKQMQELYKESKEMPYKQMDVKSLQFADSSFDCVVDKGTLDSVLCGDGSGPNAQLMLSEIHRVLQPNGVYICISYGVKDQRNDYFVNREFDWTVSHHMVAKPTISTANVVASERNDEKNYHWVYIMRKQAQQ